MNTADFWVNHLGLVPHPEGGYFKETYRSAEMVASDILPDRYEGDRNFSTAIYFLLRSEDRSVFHQIKSDELWHFYQGSALTIYVLQQNELQILKLGSDPNKGESPQLVIPANCWFGAKVEAQNSFVLCGCTVSPGFDFRDFEIARKDDLLSIYPDHSEIILHLSHSPK